MPVQSIGHYPSDNNWKTNSNYQWSSHGKKQKKKKQKMTKSKQKSINTSNHAEIITLNALKAGRAQNGDAVYLIAQNAFPCTPCHEHLLTTSGNVSLIIRCEGDLGGYSSEHKGVGPEINYPFDLYYHRGAVTHENAPENFPDHPAVTVSYRYD